MPGFSRSCATKGALRLTELDVVALEVEDLGAAKDGHVLELRLADRRAVVRDDHELGLAVPQHLHHSLVACTGTRSQKQG